MKIGLYVIVKIYIHKLSTMSSIPDYIYNHNNIEDVRALVAQYNKLKSKRSYRVKSRVIKFIAKMINDKLKP